MDAYISQAGHQLYLLVGIAAILGLGKGGVPGFATIATAATVATAPVGSLNYAVALQVPILTMIDISAAWLHKDQLDWTTVWLLLPLSFVGMALGQRILMDERMTDGMARLLVGSLLLLILGLRVYKDLLQRIQPFGWGGKSKPKEDDDHDVEHGETKVHSMPTAANSPLTPKSLLWACAVGLIGGMATMLTNSMGPILNVYLLSVRQLNPSAYIGTRAMFFCFVNLGKLPLRIWSGSIGWPMLPLATGLGCVSVVGVYCAKPILLSLSETTFVRLELAVVAFAGVRLIYMGLYHDGSS